ncbi:MAG: hypothetical protein KBG15_21895 [Kofleriaceae bacterium]|nr:hypothetical protein [Kofleriaceae bacterium]
MTQTQNASNYSNKKQIGRADPGRRIGDSEIGVCLDPGIKGSCTTSRRSSLQIYSNGKALAVECKFQGTQGTTDEKIPYALQDLEALWLPGCLVYAGEGWSKGVLHTLEASRLAAYCLPTTKGPSAETKEMDHIIGAVFGLWAQVLKLNGKRFELKP